VFEPPLICVYGAGSVGCYIGGRLLAAGARAHLIARDSVVRMLSSHGLQLSDYRGVQLRVEPQRVSVGTDPEVAREAALVLVTVKSAATAQAARELAKVLRPGTIVLSLQNGLHNARVLGQALPGCRVLAGMVQFNVVQGEKGVFHQGSEGTLEAERIFGMEPYVSLFARAGVPLKLHDNLEPVQWAKLLLNLNNPINALSDLPLRDELGQRSFRRCLGLAQAEAVTMLVQANKPVARLTPLPPAWIPRLLGVPDVLFEVLGRRTLAIDPLARSSMWEDLERGRRTEVEYLNGEVVALAQALDRQAPVNARLITLIREAETGGRRRWTGPELLADLRSAHSP
jgi:2-dehydropantoate 2-reductase